MKNILKYFVLLTSCLLFWSCEKDDICAEEDPTTQAVVLEFFDKNDPTKAKNPNQLLAYVSGKDIAIAAEGNKLVLPLMVNANTTTWNLVLNGNNDNATDDIADVVTFNYEVEQQYVSKACGYKANFILNPTDGVTTTHNWISAIEVINPNIVNPNEIHIKVLF
ncbi:hypothetical protein K5I29_01830 [Flavobacterium agricola]|uniref:Lipoprotein n=1 Tax=Flavobacterium agricola TaxID=2870839 RepID=A0ABY6LZI4_9FLAO|nr:DUF6452 family protein [Flavobacterium agricola]UYW01691.1 hypothetical protein K5I29_01830 [Flavobacterium agricola]